MALLSSEIETKKMVPICRQLATSYAAGIPILRGLEQVAVNTRDPQVRRVFTEMCDDLRRGGTLTDAARAQHHRLGPFFVNLLAAGESGGRIDSSLNDLADYYEDRLKLQRTIIAAMAYPGFLLCAAWFLGTFAYGILGKALGAMSGSGGQSSTGLIRNYFSEYFGFQLKSMSVVIVAVILFILLSRAGAFRYAWGFAKTRIWPFSRVTRNFGMARFFRSFALLTASGIDIFRSIKASAAVTNNDYIERDLLKAIPAIRDGATLVDAFASSKTLTPLAREMLAVGEESGDLEQHLKKASEYHMDQASQAVKIATTVGIQFVVLAVLCFVGYLIISFYARLYGGMLDGLGI